MTIPFRPVPPVASWVATHKEAEMVRHPKTLVEFMEMYSTEGDCREALFEHRWPQGFSCRRCGHEHAWYLRGRGLYECAGCHFQSSLTAGTVLAFRAHRPAQVAARHLAARLHEESALSSGAGSPAGRDA
jgi:hypothetical protein